MTASTLLTLSTAGLALGAVVGAGRGEVATGALVGGVAGAALGMFLGAGGAGPAPGGPPGGGGGGRGGPPAGGYGGADVFQTDPGDAVHHSGWAVLQAGGRAVEVMRLPLLDEPSGLFARLSYRDAEGLAKAWGLNLWTMDLGRAVWEQGLVLRPCQLVGSAEDARAMRSRAFCERHDLCVRAQLVADAWDGVAPVANVGKDWLAGAVPGFAFNGGWFEGDQGLPRQQGLPGQRRHGADHTDYSQLTRFWRG